MYQLLFALESVVGKLLSVQWRLLKTGILYIQYVFIYSTDLLSHIAVLWYKMMKIMLIATALLVTLVTQSTGNYPVSCDSSESVSLCHCIPSLPRMLEDINCYSSKSDYYQYTTVGSSPDLT